MSRIRVDRETLKGFSVTADPGTNRVRLTCDSHPRWGVSYASERVVTLFVLMGDALSHAYWHGSDEPRNGPVNESGPVR
jgi:hypothetical protein